MNPFQNINHQVYIHGCIRFSFRQIFWWQLRLKLDPRNEHIIWGINLSTWNASNRINYKYTHIKSVMNRGLLIPNMLFCVCEYGTIIMLFIDENGPNNVIVSQKCFTEDHVCFNPPSPLAIPAYADMLKGRFKFINVIIFIFTNVPNFRYCKINISINYSFKIEKFSKNIGIYLIKYLF